MITFETWLQQCRDELVRTLLCTPEFADEIIRGSGIEIYRHQFERGLTPKECIRLELAHWNE